jgi:hypothetical protein
MNYNAKDCCDEKGAFPPQTSYQKVIVSSAAANDHP